MTRSSGARPPESNLSPTPHEPWGPGGRRQPPCASVSLTVKKGNRGLSGLVPAECLEQAGEPSRRPLPSRLSSSWASAERALAGQGLRPSPRLSPPLAQRSSSTSLDFSPWACSFSCPQVGSAIMTGAGRGAGAGEVTRCGACEGLQILTVPGSASGLRGHKRAPPPETAASPRGWIKKRFHSGTLLSRERTH